MNFPVRLGYCCISLGKHESNFKTVTLTKARSLKHESESALTTKLYTLWKHNLEEYCNILKYNIEADIHLYRISSDLFPLADHEDFQDYWKDFKTTKQHFESARKISKTFLAARGRLCAHPGQFVSLGSPSKKVRHNSIANLELHAEIFSILDLPQGLEAPLNIHLSNGKDNLKNLPYFQESLASLSSNLRERLVFENEDKSFWTWQKIRSAFPDAAITLDFHHRRINNEGESEEEAWEACAKTWKTVRPLAHISEGKRSPLDRSHHDWVNSLPEALFQSEYKADLEIEAKKKDLATLFLKNKYKEQTI